MLTFTFPHSLVNLHCFVFPFILSFSFCCTLWEEGLLKFCTWVLMFRGVRGYFTNFMAVNACMINRIFGAERDFNNVTHTRVYLMCIFFCVLCVHHTVLLSICTCSMTISCGDNTQPDYNNYNNSQQSPLLHRYCRKSWGWAVFGFILFVCFWCSLQCYSDIAAYRLYWMRF